MFRSEGQILLTGVYRSGTSYATYLLNNHPKLSACVDVVNYMRFCYGRYEPVSSHEKYTRLLVSTARRLHERFNLGLNVPAILAECEYADEVTHAFLYDQIMCDLFLDGSITHWAEKTQLVWREIPSFLDMYPNGRVLHMVRDPRSVLASFKKLTYVPEPAYLGAVFNCLDSMERALDYRQQYPTDRYHIFTFESLLTDPEATLRSVFSFLGLSSDHDLLDSSRWLDVRGQPWRHNSVFTEREGALSPFERQEALDRWRGTLSIEEVCFCERVVDGLMEPFGYEPSEIEADWNDVLKLFIHDEMMTRHVKHWLDTGEGFQGFPTDPLDSTNWQENAARTAEPAMA